MWNTILNFLLWLVTSNNANEWFRTLCISASAGLLLLTKWQWFSEEARRTQCQNDPISVVTRRTWPRRPAQRAIQPHIMKSTWNAIHRNIGVSIIHALFIALCLSTLNKNRIIDFTVKASLNFFTFSAPSANLWTKNYDNFWLFDFFKFYLGLTGTYGMCIPFRVVPFTDDMS